MVKRFEAPKPICIQARRLLETKLMVGLVTARTVRATTEYILEIILKLRPHGQAVKTPPFHGGIPGSNPGGVTIIIEDNSLRICLRSTGKPPWTRWNVLWTH